MLQRLLELDGAGVLRWLPLELARLLQPRLTLAAICPLLPRRVGGPRHLLELARGRVAVVLRGRRLAHALGQEPLVLGGAHGEEVQVEAFQGGAGHGFSGLKTLELLVMGGLLVHERGHGLGLRLLLPQVGGLSLIRLSLPVLGAHSCLE